MLMRAHPRGYRSGPASKRSSFALMNAEKARRRSASPLAGARRLGAAGTAEASTATSTSTRTPRDTIIRALPFLKRGRMREQRRLAARVPAHYVLLGAA